MADQEVDPTTETQPDAVTLAFGSSERPQRIRRTTKFYAPVSSARKRPKKMVGRPKKRAVRNEKLVSTGAKRKTVDVSIEQSKKRKVAEPAESEHKLDFESDEDEEHQKKKLIKVRPVLGKKHVQLGRCF